MYGYTSVAGSAVAAASLPYTGVNVFVAALVGFAVLSVGVSLRRLAPKRGL